MTARAKKGESAPDLSTSGLAFAAWRDAAEKWRRLRSDAAEAECRKARTAYYTLVYGTVPPLKCACESCEDVRQRRKRRERAERMAS